MREFGITLLITLSEKEKVITRSFRVFTIEKQNIKKKQALRLLTTKILKFSVLWTNSASISTPNLRKTFYLPPASSVAAAMRQCPTAR